ncbi:ribosomal protein S3Ae, putative [Trichomonas vaginalis G3]|uniref:Ribosomal protein S3Ae, putative n=1 Tax=Trichomonas vaginalis (strain ATCC PRA-98 / G3) TaxID=412133 RepID=A2FWR9_TRIV3|nr:Chain B Ribosomal Protein S3ae [Trichomonas vaginalis G3]EAX90662.1 ribosomal protein S3Ae, putative [Trichomonas vaginalis G3]KAI5553850.1 Chain B Ribosomal Protein S3ae [Trichomonas vaginalis G3]|eukprot:XP_001303592.1 ribosomal protein S3Ae [Trichomonas vaginalis G3]
MGASKQQRPKTSKKIKQDSFIKKEWRHVLVPAYFTGKRDIGVTVSNKCARGRVPMDYINNRVWELSHADMVNDLSHAYRLFSWRSIAAGSEVYTQFAGMRLTHDKLDSIMRKYRTMIDASVDAKTADGFILRLFTIGFTKKLANSHKNHTYANSHKARQVRDVMIKALTDACEANGVEQLCKDFVDEKIENEIVEKCKQICQIESVYITKVKVIKAPALSNEQVKTLKISKDAAQLSLAPTERPTEE